MFRVLGLGVLAFALALTDRAGQLLTLEMRVFDGTREVTESTRVTVHRAGDRGEPAAHVRPGRPRALMQIAPGIYDAQALQERDGRVVSIRWAERLVIMPYPDEAGHHLQVINFANGYGALQIRTTSGDPPRDTFTLFTSGALEPHEPVPGGQPDYTLFVVPAGQYDIEVRRGTRTTRFSGIEVPLDRTRLWVAPRTDATRGQFTARVNTLAGNQTTRRPLSILKTTTTSAMTSRMWIRPPANSSASPNTHNSSNMATTVHSICVKPPAAVCG